LLLHAAERRHTGKLLHSLFYLLQNGERLPTRTRIPPAGCQGRGSTPCYHHAVNQLQGGSRPSLLRRTVPLWLTDELFESQF
jgi:hypothetical protein